MIRTGACLALACVASVAMIGFWACGLVCEFAIEEIDRERE